MPHKIKSYKLSDYDLLGEGSTILKEFDIDLNFDPDLDLDEEVDTHLLPESDEAKGVANDFRRAWDKLSRKYTTRFYEVMSPYWCKYHSQTKSKIPTRAWNGVPNTQVPTIPDGNSLSIGVIRWSDIEDYNLNKDYSGVLALQKGAKKDGAIGSQLVLWRGSLDSGKLEDNVYTTSYFQLIQGELAQKRAVAISWPSGDASGEWGINERTSDMPGGYLRAGRRLCVVNSYK